MPVAIVKGRRGAARKEYGAHSILLGALGSLLRVYGIAVVVLLLDIPGFIADLLRSASATVASKGVTTLGSIATGALHVSTLSLLLFATGVAAWLLGGKLLDRGWKALTSRWSRRARLALLAFNAIGTALWVLGLVVLAYPFVSAYLGGTLGTAASYLETLVATARSVHAALLAFALSALTPAFAGILHATQAWGRGGRIAATLLAVGGLVYGINTLIVYIAWRRFAETVLSQLPHGSIAEVAAALTGREAALILKGLGDIFAMLGVYLEIAMVSYLLWAAGFTAAWLDYRRASMGT